MEMSLKLFVKNSGFYQTKKGKILDAHRPYIFEG